jgi:hypothetical protein
LSKRLPNRGHHGPGRYQNQGDTFHVVRFFQISAEIFNNRESGNCLSDALGRVAVSLKGSKKAAGKSQPPPF